MGRWWRTPCTCGTRTGGSTASPTWTGCTTTTGTTSGSCWRPITLPPPAFPTRRTTTTRSATGGRGRATGVGDVAHDAEDALIADAGFTYAYDAEGRLESRTATGSGELTTYHWDSFDQLVRIAYEDGTETTFAYDGLGRRIEVDHRGEVRRFVWDLDEVRAVLDDNDALLTWHTTDPWGFLLAEWDAVAETADDALSNHLMTVTGLVDGDGNLQQVRRDSFGNGGSGGFDAFALTWHSQDPTGLIYARGRYLDPATGRFISEDVFASANLYAYAGNDPLTAWDPSGWTASEYGNLSEKTSHGAREGATRVGLKIACFILADASAIELITEQKSRCCWAS